MPQKFTDSSTKKVNLKAKAGLFASEVREFDDLDIVLSIFIGYG